MYCKYLLQAKTTSKSWSICMYLLTRKSLSASTFVQIFLHTHYTIYIYICIIDDIYIYIYIDTKQHFFWNICTCILPTRTRTCVEFGLWYFAEHLRCIPRGWYLLHMRGQAAIVALDIEGGTEQAQASGKCGSATDPNGFENGGWPHLLSIFIRKMWSKTPNYSISRIWNWGLPFYGTARFSKLCFYTDPEQCLPYHHEMFILTLTFKSQTDPWLAWLGGLIFFTFSSSKSPFKKRDSRSMLNPPFTWDSGTLWNPVVPTFCSVQSGSPWVFSPDRRTSGAPLCTPCQSGAVPFAAGGHGSKMKEFRWCFATSGNLISI